MAAHEHADDHRRQGVSSVRSALERRRSCTHPRRGTLLVREQKPDGGWAQLPGLNSDAYTTGMVLVALHEAGNVAATIRSINAV